MRAILVLACLAVPAWAQALNPQTIIRLESEANGRCRGGSGDQQPTWQACGERAAYGNILEMLNWCYGRNNEAGYQMNWHACGPGSLHRHIPRQKG